MFVHNRAVDGNLEANYRYNSCTHTSNSLSPWLVVDLQGNYAITHIKIKNREDCCSKKIFILLSRFSKVVLVPYKMILLNIEYVV